MTAEFLKAKIERLEEERAAVRKHTAGHYSRTVRYGAYDRLEDIDTLLAKYRADLLKELTP